MRYKIKSLEIMGADPEMQQVHIRIRAQGETQVVEVAASTPFPTPPKFYCNTHLEIKDGDIHLINDNGGWFNGETQLNPVEILHYDQVKIIFVGSSDLANDDRIFFCLKNQHTKQLEFHISNPILPEVLQPTIRDAWIGTCVILKNGAIYFNEDFKLETTKMGEVDLPKGRVNYAEPNIW